MRHFLFFISSIVIMSCSRSPKFEMMSSEQTGIDFNNTITESDSFNLMKYEYIYNGAGVGIADLNNDGLQDIIFAGNQVSPRVYLNTDNFKFRDITSSFSGLTNDRWYSGVAIADINNDGWPDVYMTATENKDPQLRKNKLWINNGEKSKPDMSFTEMAEQYGIADTCWSTAAAFFDYDRDGLLDLYVLNNTVNSRMNTNYREKITDGSAQNNDRLYHNNGNGTFSDVTKQAGIVYEGFGLGLALGDINKDGFPDIYVSNDFISNDLLYINQGDGTFRNEISKYLSYQSRSSMGNDIADINNDGLPDIYTLDMLPENYSKKKQTINGFSYLYYKKDEQFGFEHQYVRNMLHLHNGFMKGELLPYSEIGQISGIDATDWSWSPLFADYDNDGDKDLLISNGFPKDETDKDWTKLKATAEGFYASDRTLISMAPSIKIPNLAFENTGNLNFVKMNDWLPQVPSYSYGAAFVDLDNDGDLDYVANNINDEAFILKNTTIEKSKKPANYLRIRLAGNNGNTMGIGAKIELWEKGKYQFYEHFLTRGYASSVDPVIHFGVSTDNTIDSIRVIWPIDNKVSILKDIKVNQTIDVNESNSLKVPEKAISFSDINHMFRKEESTIDYVHQQVDFVDFYLKQKLTQHKFSQIGPKIAKGDLNNDGKEDLIVGSTSKLPTTVLIRKGNNFTPLQIDGLTDQKEFTEGDLAIVDIDNDKDNDVIVVAGGYENETENEYKHYYYENQNGTFVRNELPIPSFSASIIKPFDFNHDGYVDFFVGSRVKVGMFPYATHSWIVINEKGKFPVNSTQKLDLGMVTDAAWTDYDKDGWEDMIVTREWNSVAFVRNMNGKELVPQIIPEMENHTGIWYSVVPGDFNNDGYEDYIVGNLGNNNRFKPSNKFPLYLYALDLDGDGTIDPIVSSYWPDQKGVMQEYPLNYLDELWSQSRYFIEKYKDYATFSYATFSDMFDKNILEKLEFKLDVNTTSSYILWNEKGKFRWELLPAVLQTSPLKKEIVEDFNDDGYPDILIGGNDYTYDVPTGNYDALKGIVLVNKGSRSEKGKFPFDVLTPSQSGILLQGMLESLIYLKGDTSLIVAGFNRAKVQVYSVIWQRGY